MSKSLIIVESPTKARTISKYLGRGYAVMASVGHVKDLPENKLGVDIQRNFTPQYVTIKGKAQVLAEIKKKAKEADKVYLAPDPDREGEAIAWHIAQEIDGKSIDGKAKGQTRKVLRVLFNEITESAIKRALQSPGQIDMNLVNAQQARRVLDRIVGYQASPLLWKKVRRGLSMGRVQSVAVKLICEREREREAFRPEEYWTITATLAGKHPPPFEAKLHSVDGREAHISTAPEAERIVAAVRGKTFIVQAIERKEKKRNPVAPFITSRLQQEAARKLRFSPKKTMTLAQQLYEGVDIGKEGPTGLITYMRTDSTRIAREAAEEEAAHPRAVRERVPARHPERLQDPAGRPGCPRGDPTDIDPPRSRVHPAVPGSRPLPTLQADLDPLHRLPDGPGPPGSHPRGLRARAHGGCLRVPGHGDRRQVCRPSRGVPGRQGRGARRAEPQNRAGDRRGGRGRAAVAGPHRRGAPAPRRAGRSGRAGPHAEAALHPTAAPVQRGAAHQGTGRERDRPALDLREHHLHDPGAPVRRESGRPLRAHGDRHHRE